MEIIRRLAEQIQEELHDAEHYVTMATEYKDEYPTVAKNMFNISLQEMEHAKILHDSIVGMIQSYKESHGEPPADMMAVYEYLHKKQIAKTAEIRMMQSLYKE